MKKVKCIIFGLSWLCYDHYYANIGTSKHYFIIGCSNVSFYLILKYKHESFNI